jgi:hypothetical protein
MLLFRNRLFSIYTLLILLGSPFVMNAQSSGISPYSRYGIGNLDDQNGAQSFSMGQTGTALNPWAILETGKRKYYDTAKHDTVIRYVFVMDSLTPYFINLKNPASYFYNRITTFEAGILNNNLRLTTEGQVHNNSNTYFAYFALAFPLSKHMGASIGLRPYSNVGYNIITSPVVDSIGTVDNQYQGSGGINQAHVGLAYSPCRYVSFGVNLCYLFGNISNIQNVLFSPNLGAFNSQVTENTDVKDFYLNYGLMLTFRLPASWQVTIGATAAMASNVNATYSRLAVSYLFSNAQYNVDTIQDSTVKGSIRLPLMIGGGITVKKGDKWTFSFDYSMQNWSQYSYFGQTSNLSNSSQMGFGTQYIPKRNVGSFLQRVHYRAGFYYTKTYLDIGGTQLNDYALTLGIGFPIGHNDIMYRTSIVNLGLQLGRLGTTSNNLLQQDYIKVMFGFTFNDHWFIKRKYE